MSALFSPITLRGVTLPNRIVVSPVCQYSAEHGKPNTWHLIHIGGLAASGAGMLCIEGTAVEPEGRITPGIEVPPPYWRAQPHGQSELFGSDARTGMR